jgi:hypothetical protein
MIFAGAEDLVIDQWSIRPVCMPTSGKAPDGGAGHRPRMVHYAAADGIVAASTLSVERIDRMRGCEEDPSNGTFSSARRVSRSVSLGKEPNTRLSHCGNHLGCG